MVFTDQPCGNAVAHIKTIATTPQGTIEFEVPTRHYQVSATSYQDAIRAMKATNPGGFAGWARWKVDFHYSKDEQAGRCTIKSLVLKVHGDILMPQWVEEAQATAQEQTAWRTMYVNLKRHEDGHIQNGREFAVLLKERLLGIGAVSCDALESRSHQEYAQLFANLRKRDQEYDFRTDHGLLQDNPR